MTTQTSPRTRTRPLRIGDRVRIDRENLDGIIWCFAGPGEIVLWIDGELTYVAKWMITVTQSYSAPKRGHLDEWAYAVSDEAEEADPRQITLL